MSIDGGDAVVRTIKRVIKALLRPVVRRYLGPWVDRRAQLVVQHVTRDLIEYQPVLLNMAESFAVAQRQLKQEQLALAERLEFIRREILFEVRRQQAGRELQASSPIPRIVNRSKVEAAMGHLQLNLGCGHIPLEGFINVDARELDGVDVVADVSDLPFEAGSVELIHSAHLLEHFPPDQLQRVLLPYWFSLLRPGGIFTAVVPDSETMLAEYAAGRISFEELREVTYGSQEYEGNFHFNMFSQASLVQALQETGFVDVRMTVTGRRNGLCYEMKVEARKPEAADEQQARDDRTTVVQLH